MSKKQSKKSNKVTKDDEVVIVDPITGAKTTGHVWDEDIREFSNELPKWWLWSFYGTIIFSLVYWFLYPAWPGPVGLLEKGYTTGSSSITYKTDKGVEETTHWNTRALLAYEMQNDPLELKRQAMVKKIASLDFNVIAKDADKLQFVQSYGKRIFGDYCAACHQSGGEGVVGHYPNLIDDAWLWGGEVTDIETTIRNGRKGNMPAHASLLTSDEVDKAAHYVLSLSGIASDAHKAKAGKGVFTTKGCIGCHGADAKGMKVLGSANLTDNIWTVAHVSEAETIEAKVAAVKKVILGGISREMPSWQSRLSDAEIKLLVAYVKSLSSQ